MTAQLSVTHGGVSHIVGFPCKFCAKVYKEFYKKFGNPPDFKKLKKEFSQLG